MEIISTNIGRVRLINWRGEKVKTGIYKYPVEKPLILTKEGVKGDHVADLRHHGGIDKACYLFSADHYPYWKALYNGPEWRWGMFGENLTIVGLDEKQIYIGDILKIGEAVVQVSQPRQPCFKLAVIFNSQSMVRQFIDYGHPGVYVRVLEEGPVKKGDRIDRVAQGPGGFSIFEIFRIIYAKEMEPEVVHKAIADINLAESCRRELKKIWEL